MTSRSNPIVVVTGSSSGIGHATVSAAARGFHVVASVRRCEDAERLAAESDRILPVKLDVTDPASIEQAVAIIQKRFPEGIDGLVNNAGIAVAGPVEWLSRSDWQHQYDVNVFGLISVTQALLPMLRRRRGRIINISSAASSLALPMVGAYASSKLAVEGLSDSLRREVSESGVKVVVVCPGQTATRIFDEAERETRARVAAPLHTLDHDYTPALTRLQDLLHRSETSRRPPTHVANVILKALTARRPRRRYHVGWDAYVSALVQRCVPSFLVDWVIARQLRPPQS